MLKITQLILIYFNIFKLINSHMDCNMLNELSIIDSFSEENINFTRNMNILNNNQTNKISLSFWETDPLFGKCGIVPSKLINNLYSNSKFFVHWTFNSHKSFKFSFRFDFVENFNLLSYYFSIRKFSTNREIVTQIRRFNQENDTYDDEIEVSIEEALEINSNTKRKRFNLLNKRIVLTKSSNTKNSSSSLKHEPYQNLIVNFNPAVSEHGENKYEMIKQIYVICVVIINLKTGITFTLPFMCMDVFVDKQFYKSIKLSNNTLNLLRQHSLGIMISLGPFSVAVFLLVSLLFFFINKKENKETREMAKFIMENKANKLILQSLIKQSLRFNNKTRQSCSFDNELKNQDLNKLSVFDGSSIKSIEYKNERRYSRYELIEDYEPMRCQEELFLDDLIQNIVEKKSLNSLNINELYNNSNKMDINKNLIDTSSFSFKSKNSAEIPNSKISSSWDTSIIMSEKDENPSIESSIRKNNFYMNEAYFKEFKSIQDLKELNV